VDPFVVTLAWVAGFLAAPGPEDRPSVMVLVNDQPVQLTIDTCADKFALFSHAADRIDLKYRRPPLPPDPNQMKAGRVPLFRSEMCRVRMGNRDAPALHIKDVEGRRRVPVLEVPSGLQSASLDGVIGWTNIFDSVLHLDWGQKTLESLPEIPPQTLRWNELPLYSPPGPQVLALRVSGPRAPPRALYIDTGAPGGVQVASALWQEIVAQHPGLPMALDGYYTPAAGYVLQRTCWLKMLRLGDLELHDVPVSEMPEATQRLPSCLATVGLYGLTRLELIVDGRHDRAYVRTKQEYPKRYDYNRAGVTFLPPDRQSSDLVAAVLEGGPAYEAGIRAGDRLRRVNGRDVTGWQTDPNIIREQASPFTKPAGTKLTLTVQRDGRPMEVTVTLRELLPVEPAPSGREGDRPG
jgi:hypothetical protein